MEAWPAVVDGVVRARALLTHVINALVAIVALRVFITRASYHLARVVVAFARVLVPVGALAGAIVEVLTLAVVTHVVGTVVAVVALVVLLALRHFFIAAAAREGEVLAPAVLTHVLRAVVGIVTLGVLGTLRHKAFLVGIGSALAVLARAVGALIAIIALVVLRAAHVALVVLLVAADAILATVVGAAVKANEWYGVTEYRVNTG